MTSLSFLVVNMIAIDLYFFMNAAYDLTLLCVVGIVARKRLYFGRVLAAALLGAAWSVTALIAALYFVLPSCALWIVKMITYLLCPYLMCLIAYRRNINVMQKIFMREFFLKNIELLLYFYVAGALISGLMLLLKWSGIHIPSWVLMPVCSILAVFLWRYLTKKEAQEKQIYEVTLIYQDKTFSVKALYDSGNTLMTRKSEPVHVLAPSIWKELIGEDPWKEDGFAVPYQTVSETSVMPGIYLDEIHLKEKAITEKKQQLVKENSKEKVLVLRHVPTGLGSMEFDKAGECQMLLHRDTFD